MRAVPPRRADVLDASARIGAVHLTISDLDRSIRFYRTHLGFILQQRDDRTVWFGAGDRPLLVLSQGEDAPRVRGTTGLYHFAILVPTRAVLAASLRRLVETGVALQGASDHGVSEALYLADPDGNGIEIYRDRPRSEWPIAAGHLRMTTDPLDADGLLAEPAIPAQDGLPTGTVIGHVHLHVSRLEEAERFYVDVLGFDLMQRYGHSALFVSAGGYHHHVGLNTWAGVGAPPPPAGAIGLKHFVVTVDTASALDDVRQRVRRAGVADTDADSGFLVRDASQNAIHFTLFTPP